MKFKFNHKGKEVEIDVRVCDNVFSKASGLMFRRNSKPLLFTFNKPTRQPILSFFCKPFYAIWFEGDRIVDERLIDRWMINIRPECKFDRLLEIPSNGREFSDFVDGKRNI